MRIPPRTPLRSALFDQTNGVIAPPMDAEPVVGRPSLRLVAAAVSGFGGLGR